MTNNKPDISTKNVQNGKETTADTAPETSWVPKNPPPAAAQAEPVRRVGSVTLGICLIAAGIFFFAYHFLPNFDALLVLKIVPAAGLVLLGCEVLYYATRPQRGRYDFVSVFVCLVLMGLLLWPDPPAAGVGTGESRGPAAGTEAEGCLPAKRVRKVPAGGIGHPPQGHGLLGGALQPSQRCGKADTGQHRNAGAERLAAGPL